MVRGVATDQLVDILSRSRDLGLLGPGDVATHIEHARVFLDVIPLSGRVMDLGSGGGLPGLILATSAEVQDLTLVDSSARRVAFLRDAVRRLGVGARVTVLEGRAEELAHRPKLREAFDVVVARSFGPPAVLAECATGFIVPGGHLLVSEPENGDDRWPPTPLEDLGLVPISRTSNEHSSLQMLRRIPADLTEVPRAAGIPAKRPRF